jgi:hypothetical protein
MRRAVERVGAVWRARLVLLLSHRSTRSTPRPVIGLLILLAKPLSTCVCIVSVSRPFSVIGGSPD